MNLNQKNKSFGRNMSDWGSPREGSDDKDGRPDGSSRKREGSHSKIYLSKKEKENIKKYLDDHLGYDDILTRDIKGFLNKAKTLSDRVDRTNPFFWKLLEVATGDKILKPLLDICLRNGVDLNQKGQRGMTFLHYCLDCCRDVFENHINGDFDINIVLFPRPERIKWSILKLEHFLKMLKDEGADALQEDSEGDDILKYALGMGAPNQVITFLLHKICPKECLNTKNLSDYLPLTLALKKCSDDVAILMIKEGANPFSRDTEGNTIIHNILHWKHPLSQKMVQLIKDYAPQMKDTKNSRKVLPLMKALHTSSVHLYRLPDEVFDCLIPSSSVINDKCCLKTTDEECDGPSLLEKVVSIAFFEDEREERVRKLVAAGAEITCDVFREAIKQGPKLLNVLVELKAVPEVDHIKNCLELPNHDGIPVLKEVLKHIPDGKRIVKEQFPDILVQCLRYMRLKQSQASFDLNLVTLLLDEYKIDVNYTSPEDGSLLHWLSYFRYMDKERAVFLTELIEKYGDELNLDVLSKRDKDIEWNDDSDLEELVTPLQIALENCSYRVAQVLIKNFASIDKLCFKNLKSMITYGVDDAALHVLIEMLKFLGSSAPELDDVMQRIKTKHESFEKLHETKTEPSSLLELTCQSIRQKTTRTSVLSFMGQFDLGPKVKDYLFLNHIKELNFPQRIPIMGANGSDDDDYDYDDDDDDFDYDDDEDYGFEYDSDEVEEYGVFFG